jgi:hypothetical protein
LQYEDSCLSVGVPSDSADADAKLVLDVQAASRVMSALCSDGGRGAAALASTNMPLVTLVDDLQKLVASHNAPIMSDQRDKSETLTEAQWAAIINRAAHTAFKVYTRGSFSDAEAPSSSGSEPASMAPLLPQLPQDGSLHALLPTPLSSLPAASSTSSVAEGVQATIHAALLLTGHTPSAAVASTTRRATTVRRQNLSATVPLALCGRSSGLGGSVLRGLDVSVPTETGSFTCSSSVPLLLSPLSLYGDGFVGYISGYDVVYDDASNTTLKPHPEHTHGTYTANEHTDPALRSLEDAYMYKAKLIARLVYLEGEYRRARSGCVEWEKLVNKAANQGSKAENTFNFVTEDMLLENQSIAAAR